MFIDFNISIIWHLVFLSIYKSTHNGYTTQSITEWASEEYRYIFASQDTIQIQWN